MGAIQKEIRVIAIMTAPRYEATWCRNHIEWSLRALNIPLSVSGGVYYGQCMQIMLEDAIKANVQYAITVDGDSVFRPSHVQRLLNIVVQEDLDSLASLQLRRGNPNILGFKAGTTKAVWSGYPMEVDTAHFGLTVLNLERLAKVEKPWFFCKPDENGEWKDGRIDSDIWFWCQWKAAGLKCWIDPGCRIGHTEEMIATYDENYKPVHMYPKEWEAATNDSTATNVASSPSGQVA